MHPKVLSLKAHHRMVKTMVFHMLPRPETPSPGNSLELQNFGSYPRSEDNQQLGDGPAVCVITSPGDRICPRARQPLD